MTKLLILAVFGLFAKVCMANICTDAGLGTVDGFLPHPTECHKYYSCYGGQPIELQCPEGYNFNPTVKKCDPKYNCLPNTCPPAGVVKQPVPDSCTQYVLCIGGKQYPDTCAEGMFFDKVTLMCLPAEDVDCVENMCDPAGGVPQFFPHPTNCQIFFICDENFEPIEFQCGTGTIFDPAVNDCVLGTTCPGTETTTTAPGVTTTTADPALPTTTAGPLTEPATISTDDPLASTTTLGPLTEPATIAPEDTTTEETTTETTLVF